MTGLLVSLFILALMLIDISHSANILALFPYNGKSHHIYFSTFVEELAARQHKLVVVNYFQMNNMTNLKQISLQESAITKDTVEIVEQYDKIPIFLKDFPITYHIVELLKNMGNENCKKMFRNKDLMELINSEEKFDVIIVEQFITDCGFAIANRFKAPVVGMTAHVPLPWTYSRLGADNNPAFVPSIFTGSDVKPDLWNRIKNTIINFLVNFYYKHVTQKNDYEIVKKVFPDAPDLELLANNMSLVLLNQYFPLTGSRIYGANVIEIGGMHVKHRGIIDKNLQQFLDTAENGVIYISFGTVASDLPKTKINKVLKFIRKSKFRFVWKIDHIPDDSAPKNLFAGKWMPQVDILCHAKVLAFVSHSGMLSSSEAMHCGVPLVSVPLFGDQFANSASARASGLGVTLNFEDLDDHTLKDALDNVLKESFIKHVKQLSLLWKDRPMSPMDTAVYWVEYVAKHGAVPQLRPATVGLPLYQYLLIDVWIILGTVVLVMFYLLIKIFIMLLKCCNIIYIKKLKKGKKE